MSLSARACRVVWFLPFLPRCLFAFFFFLVLHCCIGLLPPPSLQLCVPSQCFFWVLPFFSANWPCVLPLNKRRRHFPFCSIPHARAHQCTAHSRDPSKSGLSELPAPPHAKRPICAPTSVPPHCPAAPTTARSSSRTVSSSPARGRAATSPWRTTAPAAGAGLRCCWGRRSRSLRTASCSTSSCPRRKRCVHIVCVRACLAPERACLRRSLFFFIAAASSVKGRIDVVFLFGGRLSFLCVLLSRGEPRWLAGSRLPIRVRLGEG